MSTEKLHIESIAPVRVDLAGGTVDLWPIYLLLDQPKTLNFGVNLFATTTVKAEPSAEPKVLLTSQDQNVSKEFSWDQVKDPSFTTHPGLELPLRLLRFFSNQHPNPYGQHFSLTTEAKSPAGAGLGGSSALSISIIGALWKWVHPTEQLDLEKEGEFLIALTRDVESQVLFTPAGLQDYYGAAFGGLQTLSWNIAQNSREGLPESTLKKLGERTLLFYSGKSRNSGINNWQLFKGFLDRDAQVIEKFKSIVSATNEVLEGLHEQNFSKVVTGVQKEWNTRRTLASGISTEEMDAAFARASKITDVAFKVCGAGGGGCFFVLFKEKDAAAMNAVKEAILSDSSGSIRELPFQVVPHGLRVSIKGQHHS